MKKETSEKSIQTVAEDLDSDKCSSQDDTELDKVFIIMCKVFPIHATCM